MGFGIAASIPESVYLYKFMNKLLAALGAWPRAVSRFWCHAVLGFRVVPFLGYCADVLGPRLG
jgi:hypothetical protein